MRSDGDLVYVDTSIIVKTYLHEPDSKEAIALLSRLTVATSEITELELCTTLHAAARARALSKGALERLLRQVERDRNSWYRLALTAAVLDRAREIVASHPLRTLDAVHCASAMVFAEAALHDVAFATSDRRQREAAVALGFSCVELRRPAL